MFQVGSVITLAEAIIVVVATVVGPFLALLVFRLLLFGTIDPRGGAEVLEIGLRADMFIFGAVGGLMSLAVLLAANFNLTRLGLLDFLRERARPPAAPYLQRYYIDLLVIAALGLVWWQVEQRGGFLERTLTTGQAQLDLTLLLAPSLSLLTAAFLIFRVLPLVVRALAWAARWVAPAWASFALARVARDPLPYGSLTVIVMLSAALGVFGSSFQTTLEKSQREQALYRTGGDLVVSVVAPTGDTETNIASLPSIHAYTPVERDSVTLLDTRPGTSATLLAIDPVALVDVAWYREDFSPSGKTLSSLLTPLRRGQSRLPDLSGNLATGIPIPEETATVGLWINTENFAESAVQQSLGLWLRMVDSDGSHFNLDMGDVELSPGGLQSLGFGQLDSSDRPGEGEEGSGWRYYEAPVPEEKYWLDPPHSVVAVFFVGRSLYRMPPGAVYVDDITANLKTSDPSGSSDSSGPPGSPGETGQAGSQVVEDFDEIGRWVALPHDGEVADRAAVTGRAGRGDGRGLEFTWQDPLLQEPRGFFIPPGDFPLAAVGSPALAGPGTLRVNLGRQLAPLAVQDTIEHFPTISERNKPFLLVSLTSLQEYTSRIPRGIPIPPRQFWLTLESGVDREQAIRSLREATSVSANITDRAGLVDRAERDPLAGGGWNGLTLLGLGALTIVVTLTLAIHALVAVRTARVELTIVRAVGFSHRQLLGLLVLERVLVAGLGLVAGALLGYFLGSWTLGLMGVTPSGIPIIPPMVQTTQPWLIGLVLLNLVVAAAVGTVVATLAADRLKPSDILRNSG